MVRNLRSKIGKDIESPSETVISGINQKPGNTVKSGYKPDTGITGQITATDDFDDFIEKIK